MTVPLIAGTRLVALDESYAGRVDAVWCDPWGRVRCVTIVDDQRGCWRNVPVDTEEFEVSWLH